MRKNLYQLGPDLVVLHQNTIRTTDSIKQNEGLPFRIKVFRVFFPVFHLRPQFEDEWRLKPSVLVQTENKKTKQKSLQHRQNTEKNQTGRRRRSLCAAVGGTQKKAELQGGHMIYLQILETTNHLHPKRQNQKNVTVRH